MPEIDSTLGLRIVDSQPYFSKFNEFTADNCKKHARTFRIRKQWEVAGEKSRKRECSGDAILNKLFRTLPMLTKKVRVDQKTMHSHMISALLPLIYGDELEQHRERLLKILRLDKISQELIILADRRRGKTWGVALLVAAALICIPAVEIVIFSLAQRIAEKMLMLVDKFLATHAEGRKMLIRPHTQQKLTLKGPYGPDDVRMCQSFPGMTNVRFFLCIYANPLDLIIVTDRDQTTIEEKKSQS